jgi:hypothetical protein
MGLRYKLVHEENFSFLKATAAVWSLDDDQLDSYAEVASQETKANVPLDLRDDTPVSGKLGDGQLIQVIIDWLKSDEGKAFLSALFKILLGLLAGL